jgi:hypothetical protein
VTISSPVNGHTYTHGSSYKLTYSCKAGAGATITSCSAPGDPSGTSLTATPAGTYTVTVTAKQSDGQTATRKTTFTVVNPPPTITLKTPKSGASYKKGATVKASYSCKAGSGSTLSSCKGTVATGKKISTTTVGSHSFTVTATDKDGRTAKKKVTYAVKKK